MFWLSASSRCGGGALTARAAVPSTHTALAARVPFVSNESSPSGRLAGAAPAALRRCRWRVCAAWGCLGLRRVLVMGCGAWADLAV